MFEPGEFVRLRSRSTQAPIGVGPIYLVEKEADGRIEVRCIHTGVRMRGNAAWFTAASPVDLIGQLSDD
jgi:hypothetical protein